MLGFPNVGDSATLTGGSWTSALPLSNLQIRQLGKVARSTNATLASTQFDVNFSTNPQNINVINLTNHSISVYGTYRIRIWSDVGMTNLKYDSGFQNVYPVVYPYGYLEWENNGFWRGSYTTAQLVGYTSSLNHILDKNYLATYMRIEINDTTNPAGYISIGRLFTAPTWQPVVNAQFGSASLGWESPTQVQAAISGAEYFQRRTPYRVAKFTFDILTVDESFAQAFEMFRQAGLDGEVLFIQNPNDTIHAIRTRFLGRLRTLSPIEYPNYGMNKAAYDLKELLP
jgi:hypothetical protein